MTDQEISNRYQAISALAHEIVRQFDIAIMQEGFAQDSISFQRPDHASYRLEKDPSNGEFSLIGDWFDHKGHKQGSLMFHHDGSFFVEYDIIKPHPVKKSWFVEAINAWGKDTEIKVEARLLPTV